MAGDNNRKEQSALTGAASAAGTARGAIKTGKAIAGAAKGAAAGPYGMLAAGLWENRKAVGKVLAAFAALLMLPVLFLLMLPSLIFGSLGLDDATGDALNDNSAIMENIAETEASIEAILRKRHDDLLEEIQREADALGPGCEYGITDEFSDRIIYESTLVISQFCASQDGRSALQSWSGYSVTIRTASSPTPWKSRNMRKRMRRPGKAVPYTTMNIQWNMPGTAISPRACST